MKNQTFYDFPFLYFDHPDYFKQIQAKSFTVYLYLLFQGKMLLMLRQNS